MGKTNGYGYITKFMNGKNEIYLNAYLKARFLKVIYNTVH